jgi:hypothetical protein
MDKKNQQADDEKRNTAPLKPPKKMPTADELARWAGSPSLQPPK